MRARNLLVSMLAVALSLGALALGTAHADPIPPPLPASCGDYRCEPPEDCNTCPQDCGDCCGNRRCEPPEDCNTCPQDCGNC